MDVVVVPFTAANVVGLLAGLAMLALAAWTWHLHPRLPVNRAFAAFLVWRGSTNVLGFLGFTLAGEPGRIFTVSGVLDIFLVFALVPFLLAYRRHQHGSQAGRWVHVALVLGAGVLAALWLWNPAWGPYLVEGDAFSFRPGPLLVVTSFLYWGVLVGMGLVLVRDATLTDRRPAQSSNLLLALALMAWPIHITAYIFFDSAGGGAFTGGPTAGQPGAMVMAAPLVPFAASGLVATAVLYSGARRRARPPHGHVRRFALAILLPLLTAVVPAQAAFAGLITRSSATQALELLTSVWVLAMPLIAAYALVRHQLFGVDAKVKFAVRQSTVAAAFVGVFFVVSEGAAAIFESSTNSVVIGIVAAGALVFALAPLQHVAQRVADAAMPGVLPVPQLDHAERCAIYRDQVHFAWADRSLSQDERRLLNELRRRLGVSADEAARIEDEVLGA